MVEVGLKSETEVSTSAVGGDIVSKCRFFLVYVGRGGKRGYGGGGGGGSWLVSGNNFWWGNSDDEERVMTKKLRARLIMYDNHAYCYQSRHRHYR